MAIDALKQHNIYSGKIKGRLNICISCQKLMCCLSPELKYMIVKIVKFAHE